MKQLEKIRVVQFFLFERQEILLDEITGIFGPNASGKSSMLDAVQIAMFGGNSRLVALNAQADEEQRTTRSLRAYCLGQYGETPEDRARDHATTYISLIWRDTETNEPLTMGVCISASSERDGHEVLGRYILPGYELLMSDHLELIDGEERPREWSTFRHKLAEFSRSSGNEVLFNDAQRYINAMLLALRGSGSVTNADAFSRAFRFALRMRFDKSVDQIVRNDVLEDRPTNIKRFREVTDSFKRLAELVAQVEQKLADGRRVEEDFSKAAKDARRAATWHAMGRMSDVVVADEACQQAGVDLENEQASLGEKRTKLSAIDQRVSEANEQSRLCRMKKEAHSSHRDYGALELEIRAAEQRGQEKTKSLRSEVGLLHKTLKKATESPHAASLAAEANLVLERLVESLSGPQDSISIDISGTLTPALNLAGRAYQVFNDRHLDIKRSMEEAQQEHRNLKSSLARIKEGRAPLSDNVQRLMTELEDHGLHPVPVCDLVKITDPDWQPAIESYLAGNLQALLVSEGEEAEAFRIYRNLTGPRAVYGAKLARESRQDIGRPVEAGSAAELIKGSAPAAVAFLRRMLRDIQCVKTDSEALAGKRTLTQDGMLVSGGEIERLRPVSPDRFMIGAGGDVHRSALEGKIKTLDTKITNLSLEYKSLSDMVVALRLFANEDQAKQSVEASLADIRKSKQEAETKNAALVGMADEEYVNLGKEEQVWAEKAKDLGSERDQLNRDIGASETKLETLQTALTLANKCASEAVKVADQAKADQEYDHEYWMSQWDRTLETNDGNPEGMVRHCDQQRDRAQSRVKALVYSGMQGFGVFLQKYREQTVVDTSTDWRKAHEWLSEMIERLDKTELAGFRKEMDEAYRTSQETFRNDVAIALHNNLEWLSDTMDRLNSVLRTCPTFSNGERYRFRRTVRPHLESLLKFIKEVAAFGPTQDLLGGAGEIPEAFKELLDDKVMPGAGSQRSPLDDYREFFDFDIEILREDPISKETKVIGHLSKRLGSGSGGEHRAPLYVIAGAALASAYKIDRGNHDGLRLMLLDEAFSKMDMTNIIATMRYLEELGLQLFMASPGENQGTLTAFLHRYYEILRDPENNTVLFEGHSVEGHVRDMFRSSFPEFNDDLVPNEIMVMRTELLDSLKEKAAEA